MTPEFAPEGGLALALGRGLAVAALLSVFGALVFARVVAPRAFARMTRPDILRVMQHHDTALWAALGLFGCACPAWLVLQAGDMADAHAVWPALAAVPLVLESTTFGHLIALQVFCACGVALALTVRRRPIARPAALGCSTIALALQAGHGHAASMDAGPSLLLASDIVHLLGAGGWLGGLLPLLMLVGAAPPAVGAVAARWFSPMGKLCVVAVALSASFQAWVMIGSVPGLIGTAYGLVAIAKLALLAVLLGFAAINRYRFAPALLGAEGGRAKRVLIGSILIQSGFGLAVIAAAVVLSSLPPAMHEQPLWPFPQRFSTTAIDEDPAFRAEVFAAALALAGAAALLVLAIATRRARWPALAGAALIAWFAVPHLDLLLIEAYPTSYYRSPTGFSAASIVAGAALFPQHCAACHGADGAGRGPAASDLAVPPADLTAAHLWMHSDGELFWWLSHGMDAPSGGLSMPGFSGVLSDPQRWNLIDYIRANNAGVTLRDAQAWTPTVRAPDTELSCDHRTLMLDALRGRYVRVTIGAIPQAGGTTSELVDCVAADPAAAGAYAIVAGIAPADIAGAQFIIDETGLLRAMQRPESAPSWNDPKALGDAVAALRAHPVAPPPRHAMDMRM